MTKGNLSLLGIDPAISRVISSHTPRDVCNTKQQFVIQLQRIARIFKIKKGKNNVSRKNLSKNIQLVQKGNYILHHVFARARFNALCKAGRKIYFVHLFSLMAVVSGWRRTGLFGTLGNIVCRKVHGQRGLCLTLVLLCFFSSMIITNDVALLTFVPFAVVLLSKTSGFLLLYTVVLQTLAANLGSMITPIRRTYFCFQKCSSAQFSL